jgi:hypothetical protein
LLQFDAADLDDAVTLADFQSRGFRIQYDLSQSLLPVRVR